MTQPWQTPTLLAPAASQRSLPLQGGQALRLWLPAGAMLLSQVPRLLVLQAPQVLGERLHTPREILEDGQATVIVQAGWVELQASTDGVVLCLASQARPWPQRLVSALLRPLARLGLTAALPRN